MIYLKFLLAYFNRTKLKERNINKILIINNIIHYAAITEKSKHYYILNENNDFILHREDNQPSIHKHFKVSSTGAYYFFEYYKNGILHREGDLPAVFFSNNHDLVDVPRTFNFQIYYKNGVIHRDTDEPSVIIPKEDDIGRFFIYEYNLKPYLFKSLPVNMINIYFKNGVIHRDNDKPAYIVYINYFQGYFKNGILHRRKLPAWKLKDISILGFLQQARINSIKGMKNQVCGSKLNKVKTIEKYFYKGNEITKNALIVNDKINKF
jgi:hypothetical protein